MNRYGRMAYHHSRVHRPMAFASLTNPNVAFTQLGEDLAAQITQLRDELLGKPRSGETLERYRQRSYQMQRQAEELILTEHVWSSVEPAPTQPDDNEVLSHRVRLAGLTSLLTGLDLAWTDTPAETPNRP